MNWCACFLSGINRYKYKLDFEIKLSGYCKLIRDVRYKN